MISGAKYSGVPHKVQVRPFTLFAKPKSVTCVENSTFMFPVSSFITQNETLEHKTSHTGQFFKIEIYVSYESRINTLCIDVWFVMIG